MVQRDIRFDSAHCTHLSLVAGCHDGQWPIGGERSSGQIVQSLRGDSKASSSGRIGQLLGERFTCTRIAAYAYQPK